MSLLDKIKHHRFIKIMTARSSVAIGIILILTVSLFFGHMEAMRVSKAASHASETLKGQCLAFNKLTAADRTKSLFRLAELMRDFRQKLSENPEYLNDEKLEEFVDNLRITGISIMDGDFKLVAAGHSRKFKNKDWAGQNGIGSLKNIIDHPTKIYSERILLDGEYYDICAVSREDAPGVIIGYYQQPSGLITNTESDLESLLSNMSLERNGHYAIVENGTVRATTDGSMRNAKISESELLSAVSKIPRDGRIHLLSVDGVQYWGSRTACEGFGLYIYYPFMSIYSTWLLSAAIFTLIYCLLLIMFITMRNKMLKKNQDDLRRSNRRLTETVDMLKALETLYFSMFYVDIEKNTYDAVYMSSRFSDVVPPSGSFSLLKSFLSGKMVADEFKDELLAAAEIDYIKENLCHKNISDERKSFYIDYKAIRGNKDKWCRLTVTAVDFDENGYPHHVLALLQDVNKEKTKEAEYQARILKEAEEAKIANEAKSDFLRKISHDIRTPLNGIRGYIDMAETQPQDLDVQEHCRQGAKTALHIMIELVTSILDMSKLESNSITVEKRQFDLAKLLNDINTVLRPIAAAKNVSYEVGHSDKLPINEVIGSPRHVSQIIMNITSNAVKYSKPGGIVRVNSVIAEKTDNTVTYEFICADNGIGMSEEFQKHMFEPFVQEAINARSTYEGAGLGLSIVKSLVDVLGGSIKCRSKKGLGTEFRIRLTFEIDKERYNKPSADAVDYHAMLEGRHVLLAEDNELNMEIADYMFRDMGAKITKAWNGKEAVEKFAESSEGYFDIIFMDIMMPETDGIEAARAIRALDRSDASTVPIAAMSANAYPEDIACSIEAGMNDHISKPVDKEKLLSVAEKLISRSNS